MFKRLRISLALLVLPAEYRQLGRALMQLGQTMKQIADAGKVLEIARAIEAVKQKNAASQEVSKNGFH
jgi:hypothetical protein